MSESKARDLFVKNIETGTIHEVFKMTKDKEGEVHVWCTDWYGHHIIGKDCEWYHSHQSNLEPKLKIIKFLLGETDIDGKWFGDSIDGKPFWWREKLRDEMAAIEYELEEKSLLIKEHSQQSSEDKWISVEERLPEFNKMVICYSNNNTVETLAFTECEGCICVTDFNFYPVLLSDSGITHWQPLPNPPKSN